MELVDVPTDVTEETEVVEPENADADADFAAGFDGKTEEPTGITSSPAAEGIVDPDAVSTEQPAAATKPAVKLPDLDEAQIQRILGAADRVDTVTAALEKLSGTAFGKIGGLERTLKQLQEGTPSGQAVTLSVDDMEEMKADFPELADMTVKGLNRALSKLRGTGGSSVDPAQLGQLVKQEVQVVKEQLALEAADIHMPGWRETVKSPDFKSWLTTQPAEYQENILNTWKPSELNGSIQKFNQAKQAKPTKPAGNRREQLEEGLTPRGIGGHATGSSGEDDFVGGYKAVAGFAHK